MKSRVEPGRVVVCAQEMFKSQVFRELPAKAIIILLDFMMKRRIKKGGIILNNGAIEYCFSEAKKRGLPAATFNRNRDILIERGFLEVTHAGSGGRRGDKTLYALSDDWQKWGKTDYKVSHRPKDLRQGVGFAAYWKKKKGIVGNTRSCTDDDRPK